MQLRIEKLQIESLAEARALLSRACHWDEASLVAEEKLFAPGASGHKAEALAAYKGETMVGLGCTSAHWLRLLCVCPSARDIGIGSRLLSACEQQALGHGEEIRTMAQPGNYLSPGIDKRNQETIRWMANKGFVETGSACNLLIALSDNPLVTQSNYLQRKEALSALGYSLMRMPAKRRTTDIEKIAEVFSDGWAFEVGRAWNARPCGVHIAVRESDCTLAGFAGHGGNNQGLGWFGPTGTLKEHRSKGIAAGLLLACLLDIKATGRSHAEVAWIGPRAFYEKVSGVDSDRKFSIMRKILRRGEKS